MKKIFTLIIVLCALNTFSFAQSFEIQDEIGNVITGTTVIVPTEISHTSRYIIKVRNNSGSIVTAKITKSYISGPVAGSSNTMCSPTTVTSYGSCVTGLNTPEFILNPSELSGPADLDFSQGVNSGSSTIQYKVWNVNNVADFVIINVTYSTLTAVDLASVKDFNVYPNPAAKSFTIENEFNSNSYVEVYNVLGKVVARISPNQNATNFVVDCSKWDNGYYFCRLFNDDQVVKTIKMVVTH